MTAARLDETLEGLRQLIKELTAADVLRLPTEVELAAQLGVGRSTVREALGLLAAEGEISRHRSRGTFIRPQNESAVAGRVSYPVHLILSFAEFLQAHGIEFSVRELSVRCETPDEHDQTELKLPRGGEVYRVWRIYQFAEGPAAYLEHVVRVELLGHSLDPAVLGDGLMTILENIPGVVLDSVDNTVTAEAADERMARMLAVAEGAPLLVMYTRAYADATDPIAVGKLVFRPELLSLSVRAAGRLAPRRR